jgi:hypothetical protein
MRAAGEAGQPGGSGGELLSPPDQEGPGGEPAGEEGLVGRGETSELVLHRMVLRAGRVHGLIKLDQNEESPFSLVSGVCLSLCV